MKIRDMFRMSLSSLWKRKVRTVLTVLGVVIGTASIVVMISLGLGLKRASMQEIERYGGLTTVTVTEKDSMDSGKDKKEKDAGHLDDDAAEEILELDHVEYVCPILDTDAIILAGNYQCMVNIRGVPAELMPTIGIKLGVGEFPEPGLDEVRPVFGNCVLADFMNDKTNEGYWYNGKVPDIDLMTDRLMYVFDVDKYYAFRMGIPGEDGQSQTMPKKRILKTAGIVEGSIDDYNANSYYVYADLDALKTVLKKEFRGTGIPGQPLSASGKPLKEIYYSSFLVGVDDMDNVKEVQTAIGLLGYNADSNAEWVESMQGQYKYIQLALGGIGAVSLIVAAIGITNTMMMSIYERTKEIGIMKVLGCGLGNIQGMFLMEAGYIGFIGGVIGSLLSVGLSFLINYVIKGSAIGMDLGTTADISYIPLWLVVLATGFAVIVGMVAGFFPSLRAMRLSPLAAIRNE